MSPVFRTWDEAVLRMLFEQVLDRRRDALRGHAAVEQAQNAAGDLGQLVEGLGGWIAEALAGTVSEADYRQLSTKERRKLIVRHLASPMMQPGARSEIRAALLALNQGQTDSIVEPASKATRGKQPFDAHQCRIDMLCWIEWRRGQGQSAKESQDELTVWMGRSIKGIEKWKAECRQKEGTEAFNRQLEYARLAGQMTQHRIKLLSGQVSDESFSADWGTAKRQAIIRLNRKMGNLSPQGLRERYLRAMEARTPT